MDRSAAAWDWVSFMVSWRPVGCLWGRFYSLYRGAATGGGSAVPRGDQPTRPGVVVPGRGGGGRGAVLFRQLPFETGGFLL